MLRLTGRLACALALFAAAMIAAGALGQHFAEWRTLISLGYSARLLMAARPSTAYVVPEAEGWTTFPLLATARRLRLLSHADLGPDESPEARREYRYALRLQALGPDGEVLEDRVHHYRGRASLYRDRETDKVLPPYVYRDGREWPTRAHLVVANLEALPEVQAFRVRVEEKDERLGAIYARLYQPESLQPQSRAARWKRMGGDHRTRLAEGNVYPPALLTPEERRNLLANRWRPAGPAGVADVDYRLRTLYVLDTTEDERLDEPKLPPGLLVLPERVAVIPLHERSLRLRLRLKPFDPDLLLSASSGNPGREQRVTLTWHGETYGARRHVHHVWPSGDLTLDVDYPRGWLTVASTRPAALVVERELEGAFLEATPLPRALRAAIGQAGSGTVYDIVHTGLEATPFRVDLRCHCAATEGLEAGAWVTPRYQFLDAAGAVVKEGELPFVATPSRFDWVSTQPLSPLSEAVTHTFLVPSDVAAVRVLGGSRLLVSAFNRPHDFRRRLQVANDYGIAPPEGRLGRNWFYLRPRPDASESGESPALTLLTPERPPDFDAAKLAGHYEWQDFTPRGPWLAREILVPRNANLGLREASLGVVYQPLMPGQGVTLDYGRAEGVGRQPDLLYLRQDGARQPLRVKIDGRPVFEANLVGRRGRLKLPKMAPGRHRVELDTPARGRFLISGSRPKSEAMIKRLALRLETGKTVFDYQKLTLGEDLLAFHFYPRSSAKQSRALQLDLALPRRGPGPYPYLTLGRWQYELAAATAPWLPVLGSDEAVVGAGQRFFLRLGPDVPPGRYAITLRFDPGEEGYLVLSRTRSGLSAERRIRIGAEADSG